jgi:hypothetical protein
MQRLLTRKFCKFMFYKQFQKNASVAYFLYVYDDTCANMSLASVTKTNFLGIQIRQVFKILASMCSFCKFGENKLDCLVHI